MLVVNYNSIYNNGFIAISAGVFATVIYLLMYLYDVLLVQQLFTDECILSYLSFHGSLQLSSKGGVKIWPCDLYRLFGEDIAVCQLFFQSNGHFTSSCSFNNHVSLFLW